MFQDATHRIFHPATVEQAWDALFELRTEGSHQVYPVHFARLTLVPGEPLVLDLDPSAPADSWRLQAYISPSSSREGHRLALPNPQPGILVIDQPNRSPLILRLDPPGLEPIPAGTLVRHPDPAADYPVPPDLPAGLERNARARFIYLENCSNTHITGRGTIDGSGLALRQAPGKETNINGIRLDRSHDCSISGITVRDTHFWAVHVYRSTHIRIEDVAVINPNLHTTDGFDIDSSQDVHVTRCFAHTGDDVFVVKATAMRRGPAPSPARIRFRFTDHAIVMPETDDPDTNVYDMRMVAHQDGWVYGLFCTERKDPNAPHGDLSSAVAQCGIARSKNLIDCKRHRKPLWILERQGGMLGGFIRRGRSTTAYDIYAALR